MTKTKQTLRKPKFRVRQYVMSVNKGPVRIAWRRCYNGRWVYGIEEEWGAETSESKFRSLNQTEVGPEWVRKGNGKP